jgi:hypothetical protein
MKHPSRLPFLALALLLAFPWLPRPAAATTYQMMPDRALADQARVIAGVRVVQAAPAVLGKGEPATDYRVEVERVVKGSLPGSTVVVRVPGGAGLAGVGLKIWGAPQFQTGERALLFLSPAADGTYRILHLMLGAFHRQAADGGSLALRDLSEARELVPAGEQPAGDEIRDFDKFADWLADRAAGIERARDYVVGTGAGGLGSLMDKFVLSTGQDGIPFRWFEFDQGQSVPWRVHDGGQPGLGTEASVAAFRTALQAWDDDAGSNVLYTYAGLTSAAGGFVHDDGVNAILFDDPNGDDAADGTFDCDAGGVIAVGGPYYDDSTRSYLGKLYHPVVEGDIVTNNGTQCLFQNNSRVAEEVFAHELGHTLGLGHSKVRDALMFANVHNDGRGARLSSDDQAAIASLYPVSDGNGGGNGGGGGGGGNGGGGGGGGGGTPTGPAAPASLTAAARAGTQVLLAWRDAATDETGFRIERSQSGGAFQQMGTAPANATGALVSGLTPGKAYTFRVRSVRSGAVSNPSNAATVTTPTAGPAPCGGGQALCLAGGRFRVEVDWRNQHSGGTRGKGTLTGVSDQSGTVWFFDPSVAELIVKVLDGRAVNNRFWVFAGALTDVEYWIEVTDTQTGAVRVYHNRPGDTRGMADTAAFPGGGVAAASAVTPFQEIRALTPTAPAPAVSTATAVPSACAGGPNALCLNGRFRIEVNWRNQRNGATGVGGAIPGTESTGSFWFFDPSNVELVLKVLDGRPVNGKFWVFYGALSDVEYWVTVTDTQTGAAKVYHSKPGSLSGLADTTAF